jgi:hypothetical protein
MENGLRVAGNKAKQPGRSLAVESEVEKIISGGEIQQLVAEPLKSGQQITVDIL